MNTALHDDMDFRLFHAVAIGLVLQAWAKHNLVNRRLWGWFGRWCKLCSNLNWEWGLDWGTSVDHRHRLDNLWKCLDICLWILFDFCLNLLRLLNSLNLNNFRFSFGMIFFNTFWLLNWRWSISFLLNDVKYIRSVFNLKLSQFSRNSWRNRWALDDWCNWNIALRSLRTSETCSILRWTSLMALYLLSSWGFA